MLYFPSNFLFFKKIKLHNIELIQWWVRIYAATEVLEQTTIFEYPIHRYIQLAQKISDTGTTVLSPMLKKMGVDKLKISIVKAKNNALELILLGFKCCFLCQTICT